MTTLKDLITLKNEGRLRGAFKVSMEDYHAGPGISKSQLTNFKKSPKLFAHYMQVKMTSSYKMQEGAAFDAWHGDKTPDKENFFKEYLFSDTVTRVGKGWKDAQAQGKEVGKTALPGGFLGLMKNMSTAINAHALGGPLTIGAAQLSFYWVDEATGVLCRCRPDYLPGDHTIVDLKVTDYVDAHSLSSIGTGLAYYLQAALYMRGTFEAVKQQAELIGEKITLPPFDKFKFVSVERAAPHDVAVSQYDEHSIHYANREIDRLLASYKKCVDTDKWPGKADSKVITLTVPDWVVNKEFDNE
jgi:hypothetical protein